MTSREIQRTRVPLTCQPCNTCGLSTHVHTCLPAQMLFFSADTQKALTTVHAGFAFTITTFPKTSLLPALVAGFLRVFIMQRPGMVNLPALFTSFVPTSAAVANAATRPDFDMAALFIPC